MAAVSAGLFRLTEAFKRTGSEPPDMEAVERAFRQEANRDGLKRAIYFLHLTTLLRLQAADARLGSAYNLGRALAATGAGAPADLPRLFGRRRVAGLRNELDDLVSALPTHAGRSVSMSLCWWQCALEPKLQGVQPGDRPKLAARLDRQVDLWRALLAGEKQGADMLGPEDYTTAASRLLERAASIARTVVRTHRLPLLLGSAVLVIGFFLGVAVGGVGGTVAAIGAVAAALGISWKGVGSTVTGLAGQLREPLWQAELDLAIAEAITDAEVRNAYRRLGKAKQRCRDPL